MTARANNDNPYFFRFMLDATVTTTVLLFNFPWKIHLFRHLNGQTPSSHVCISQLMHSISSMLRRKCRLSRINCYMTATQN